MNNEPVAYVDNVWINRPDLAMDLGIGQMFSRCQLSDHQIPLYTHPVKELTDEQIFKLAEMLEIKMNHALYAFARTLIKNAQENLECYEKLSDASKMVSKPISEKSRAILKKAQEK